MSTYNILSIDIGTKNLGYTLITFEQDKVFSPEDLQIRFGIETVDRKDGTSCPSRKDTKKDVIVRRHISIQEFFENIGNVQTVVIEKQVPQNEVAMCLMYMLFEKACSIVGVDNVYLFDPKQKFLSLSLNYNTNSKHHKKQSIQFAYNFLRNTGKDNLLKEFVSFHKKDDIADSLNQGLVWMCTKEMFDKVYLRECFLKE